MYNCIIVDDSEIDRLNLQSLLRKFPQFRVIGVFDSAIKALQVVDVIAIDVVFLDIQMPGLSGVEFRKKVKSIPVCVFTTYSPEYAVQSFELETLDYLVKPLRYDRFELTVSRIEAFMLLRENAEKGREDGDHTFYIKDGTQLVKINPDTILYLKAMQDYTEIVMESGRQTVLASLGNLLKNENFSAFLRIHRSYAVYKKDIYKVNNTEIILKDGTNLPIGKTYKENLLQSL